MVHWHEQRRDLHLEEVAQLVWEPVPLALGFSQDFLRQTCWDCERTVDSSIALSDVRNLLLARLWPFPFQCSDLVYRERSCCLFDFVRIGSLQWQIIDDRRTTPTRRRYLILVQERLRRAISVEVWKGNRAVQNLLLRLLRQSLLSARWCGSLALERRYKWVAAVSIEEYYVFSTR